MNLISKFKQCWITLIFMITLVSNVYAEQSSTIYGLISFVSGEATITKGEKVLPVKLSMKVEANDTIITKEGIVRIQIADAYICHIEKNTTVIFKKILENSNLKSYGIDLHKGQIFSRLIPDKNKPTELFITTPSVTAGVRGTDFMVSEAVEESKPDQKSIASGVYVSTGSVDVETSQKDKKINLKSGEQATIAPGALIKAILDDYVTTKMKILDELRIMKEFNCKLIEEQKEKNRKLLEEFK